MLTSRDAVYAVDRADQLVSIATACQIIGVDVPNGYDTGRSLKLRCPFGEFYHRDGGVDPSFRIYPDTNSAYCFRCSAYYTPTRLLALKWDCSPTQAAAYLMEHIGAKPLTRAEAWAKAVEISQPPATAQLADALKTFCARVHPTWEVDQFEPDIATVLVTCLELLDRVSTDTDAAAWLAACKTAMQNAFTLRTSSDSVDSR